MSDINLKGANIDYQKSHNTSKVNRTSSAQLKPNPLKLLSGFKYHHIFETNISSPKEKQVSMHTKAEENIHPHLLY